MPPGPGRGHQEPGPGRQEPRRARPEPGRQAGNDQSGTGRTGPGRTDPEVRACALCHYPNGKGRAENAPIAGYPVAYFIQQMNDFKNGNRKSADPKKANTNAMIAIAKAMTDEEIKATAEYFGSMPWTPWIKVVETETVPKTRIAGGLFLALDGDEKEPLGKRIIEVPENTEATEMYRNPRSGFIAYAPPGSIKKGEALVTSGGGKTWRAAPATGRI